MSGTVEVDEAYLRGPEGGTRGRGSKDKVLIFVAAQEHGNGIERVQLRGIRGASATNLVPFVEESMEPGGVVDTDG